MSIIQILILGAIALVIRSGIGRSWYSKALLFVNLLALFWLQPAMPIRWMDFWLPTATVTIVMLTWFVVAANEEKKTRRTFFTAGFVFLIFLGIGLTRYLNVNSVLTASRPPQITSIIIAILFITGIFFLISKVLTSYTNKTIPALIIFFLLLFVIIKQPDLAMQTSKALRMLVNQGTERASALDIRWLGYSYVVFRMIHTLRDKQSGRLPVFNLEEYINYSLFFSAVPAGPIERVDRFIKELRSPSVDHVASIMYGAERIFWGIFKKFAIADSLSLIALNASNATQVHSTHWQWVIVYAYAIQIFMDFSGYTDIAIGLARWVGVKLPENFNHPYLKPNLIQFWNNWHMTLTQWFRGYFFNPLTRSLKSSKKQMPANLIIFIAQVSTMGLIGLWHGVTWNFLIWGLWHGVGLFINNRWSEFMKPHMARIENRKFLKGLYTGVSTILTIQYVVLGWVWFALPDVGTSLIVLKRLAGL